MSANGYANPEALVETDWVAAHLNDPNVRLIEVDVDTAAYDTGHIRGAVGWDWRKDLQRRPDRDIPDRDEWAALLSRSGVRNDSRVILYGDNNNWFAAFAYWLFRLYGHDNIALLNGGRAKWSAENRELTTEAPNITPTNYQVTGVNPELRALRDDVAAAVRAGSDVLIDVRGPQEFSGELLAPANLPQEGAQRGGHIRGAANVPWSTAVAADGTFKSHDELADIYGAKGARAGQPTITYCRIGERAAHTWFALSQLLGYDQVRNYDGSWTEWGSLVGAPIETGE